MAINQWPCLEQRGASRPFTNAKRGNGKSLSMDMFPCAPHPARPGNKGPEGESTVQPKGGKCVPIEFKAIPPPQAVGSFLT